MRHIDGFHPERMVVKYWNTFFQNLKDTCRQFTYISGPVVIFPLPTSLLAFLKTWIISKSYLKAPDPPAPEDARQRTNRAAEILGALAGPQGRGPSPPPPGRPPGAASAEQPDSKLGTPAGRDGRQRRQRFRFRLEATGRLPAPAQAVWKTFRGRSSFLGITQVDGRRDRGGRLMSLPLSAPVSSGFRCFR